MAICKNAVRKNVMIFSSGVLACVAVMIFLGMAFSSRLSESAIQNFQKIQAINYNIMVKQNENFHKWLIDEGNFRYYSTMENAKAGYDEEMKERRDAGKRREYQMQILNLMKKRGMTI